MTHTATRILNRLRVPLLCLCFTACTTLAGAADWPRWRGPNGDGTCSAADWNPAALKGDPKILWKVDVGTGFSSMAIAGGRVFTQGNKNDQCVIACLDEATGNERWTHTYQPGKNSYPGPRSTPTVDGEVVYVTGREGDVFCLSADTGTVVWSRDLAKEEGLPSLRWGLASSPLVLEDRVYLNTGQHGVCLDKGTGKTLWKSPAEAGGYATPVPFRFHNEEALAVFSAKSVFVIRRKDGVPLWSHEWQTAYDVNASDPIVSGNRLFVSSGYKRGSALFDLSDTPTMAWESKEMCNHFGTPVLLDGYLYACSGNTGKGRLQCMEMSSGNVIWTEDTGFCSVIMVDKKLIVLNELGQLTIAAATPKGFVPLSSGKVLHQKVCWTAPAFANGRIYCRNNPGTLVCVDVSK